MCTATTSTTHGTADGNTKKVIVRDMSEGMGFNGVILFFVRRISSQQLTRDSLGLDIIFSLSYHPILVPYLQSLITCIFAQLKLVNTMQTTQFAERVLDFRSELLDLV